MAKGGVKRICIITKFLKGVHPEAGGMETHTNDLIKGLKGIFDITIVSSVHPGGKSEEIIDGVKVYYVNCKITRNPFSRNKYFRVIAEKLKKLDYSKRFDLINIQSDFGMGYFKFIKKKLPIISTIHGTTFNEFKGSIKAKPFMLPVWLSVLPFYRSDERKMMNASDKIICVSNAIRRDAIRQYGVPLEKLIVIFNGVDTKKFRKYDQGRIGLLREKLAGNAEFIFLSAGYLTKQKGYHRVLEVFPEIIKSHPNTKFVIVGDGPYKQELMKKVYNSKLSGKVLFVGKVDSDRIVDYYNLSDVFIFPSLREESFGLVIAEAMACEKPFIISKNMGIVEMIKNKHAGIDVDNRDDILKAMNFFIKNKPLCKKSGENGRKLVLRYFNVTDMNKKMVEIFEETSK